MDNTEQSIETVKSESKQTKLSRGQILAIVAVVLFYVLYIGFVFIISFGLGIIGGLRSEAVDVQMRSVTNSQCNVQVIPIQGEIYASGGYDGVSADTVITDLMNAGRNNQIKAVVLNVDSPGGEPAAGQEIYENLKHFNKPVVTWVRQIGASAAYWGVMGTDHIVAGPTATVGSIGVTASYLSPTSYKREDGLEFQDLSTGKYKDTGNPDKPLTSEEKSLIKDDVAKIFDLFLANLGEARPDIGDSALAEIRTGAGFLAEKAKDLGLIDEAGGLPEVYNYLKNSQKIQPDLCWQLPNND